MLSMFLGEGESSNAWSSGLVPTPVNVYESIHSQNVFIVVQTQQESKIIMHVDLM